MEERRREIGEYVGVITLSTANLRCWAFNWMAAAVCCFTMRSKTSESGAAPTMRTLSFFLRYRYRAIHKSSRHFPRGSV
jgi:hypothetical protein